MAYPLEKNALVRDLRVRYLEEIMSDATDTI